MSKPRYRVTIEPMSPEAQKNWGPEYRFSADFQKLYGDRYYQGGCFRSKEEILATFNRMRESWEGFDSILERPSDKVTMRNLEFRSSVNGITEADLDSILRGDETMVRANTVQEAPTQGSVLVTALEDSKSRVSRQEIFDGLGDKFIPGLAWGFRGHRKL